ncbi:hypothetical protein Pcinc_034960 [Petrolisthes cinctipes]|uniref:Uncharacterized protein n=1 Tax=Petrolisthes cinctipes TaxID=88211 RepID=A0AAE1BXS4_PETCI|nr:hypothetical protein Pcinc_034960 [Petrolisthes cinctipes]
MVRRLRGGHRWALSSAGVDSGVHSTQLMEEVTDGTKCPASHAVNARTQLHTPSSNPAHAIKLIWYSIVTDNNFFKFSMVQSRHITTQRQQQIHPTPPSIELLVPTRAPVWLQDSKTSSSAHIHIHTQTDSRNILVFPQHGP